MNATCETGNTNLPLRKDQLVCLAVALEYESFVLRITALQVALAMLFGLVAIAVGTALLVFGISGGLKMTGEASALKFNLASTAPGLVFALIGGIVVSLAVMKRIERTFSAEVLGEPKVCTGHILVGDNRPPTMETNGGSEKTKKP